MGGATCGGVSRRRGEWSGARTAAASLSWRLAEWSFSGARWAAVPAARRAAFVFVVQPQTAAAPSQSRKRPAAQALRAAGRAFNRSGFQSSATATVTFPDDDRAPGFSPQTGADAPASPHDVSTASAIERAGPSFGPASGLCLSPRPAGPGLLPFERGGGLCLSARRSSAGLSLSPAGPTSFQARAATSGFPRARAQPEDDSSSAV